VPSEGTCLANPLVAFARSSFSVFSAAGLGVFIQSQAGSDARSAAAATIFKVLLMNPRAYLNNFA
jgi:hypothetical protein